MRLFRADLKTFYECVLSPFGAYLDSNWARFGLNREYNVPGFKFQLSPEKSKLRYLP